MQIFLHDSHPPPVVDNDENYSDRSYDEHGDGDGGGVVGLGGGGVGVRREPDGGVQQLNAAVLAGGTDTAPQSVAGVEIIGTLAAPVVQR